MHAQDIRFNQVVKNVNGQISDIAQDNQGFLWITTFDQGLKRYDGISIRSYTNDQRNPNSIASGYIITLFIDADNIIWMGILGSGLEKFDPATNTFTHFRHDPKDVSGLSNDTVSSVLEDHLGNLWVGTSNGLDLLDRKTGKFTHYSHDMNDPSSLSHREVFKVFEDKKGELWIGCWPFTVENAPGTG